MMKVKIEKPRIEAWKFFCVFRGQKKEKKCNGSLTWSSEISAMKLFFSNKRRRLPQRTRKTTPDNVEYKEVCLNFLSRGKKSPLPSRLVFSSDFDGVK
jgi:hypothetical protein